MSNISKIALVIPTRTFEEGYECFLSIPNSEKVFFNEVVIVVDDIGTSEKSNSCLSVIYTGSKLSGPANVRNIGIRALKNKPDCIFFLDDDCKPDKGWVKGHLSMLEKGAVASSGPTFFNFNKCFRHSILEHFSGLLPFYWSSLKGKLRWAPTSNISVKYSVIKKEPFSTNLYYGEDIEWCHRIRKYGELLAAPSAIVWHNPWKLNTIFIKKIFKWGLNEFPFKTYPIPDTVKIARKKTSWAEHVLIFSITIILSLILGSALLFTITIFGFTIYFCIGLLSFNPISWNNGYELNNEWGKKIILISLDFIYSSGAMFGRLLKVKNTLLIYTLDGLPSPVELHPVLNKVVEERSKHRKLMELCFICIYCMIWILMYLNLTNYG